WRLALRSEERLDRMHVQRIEMPIARGAQKHTFRHVLAPKLHRLTNDQMFNAVVSGLCGERESKRPRANDHEIGFHFVASGRSPCCKSKSIPQLSRMNK